MMRLGRSTTPIIMKTGAHGVHGTQKILRALERWANIDTL